MCPELPEEGLLCWGHGDSGVTAKTEVKSRLLGNCTSHSGHPGLLVPLHAPAHGRERRGARAHPGKMVPRQPRGAGPLCFGEAALGTRLSLKLVPPFGSGGGRGGMNCGPEKPRPGPATSPRSLARRGAPARPPLWPGPGWRRAAVFPQDTRGSGPHLHFCAGELAQPLPPLIPTPILNTSESREKPSGRLEPNSLQLCARVCVRVCALGCGGPRGTLLNPEDECRGERGTR